jgi:hypothetical protein
MDETTALKALRSLRDGLDPADGRPLPADHPCQRPDVLRALFAGVAALERSVGPDAAAAPPARRSADPSSRPSAPNQGRPWSAEDDHRLAEAFDGGASLPELAAAFGRSKNSIRARLLLLGRGEGIAGGRPPRWSIPALSPEPVQAAD